jgi:hypothetical protein
MYLTDEKPQSVQSMRAELVQDLEDFGYQSHHHVIGRHVASDLASDCIWQVQNAGAAQVAEYHAAMIFAHNAE